MLIGHPDNAVVFDFKPGIDAGAEILTRRGEDQRFEEKRPAARRRQEIDELMPERERGRDPGRRRPAASTAAQADRTDGLRDRARPTTPTRAESDPDA